MDAQKDALVKKIYLEWLCTPRIDRQPPTVSGLARLLGVQTATLLQWGQSPEFTSGMAQRIRAMVSHHLPAITASAARRAKKGDVRAMKLLLLMDQTDSAPRLKAKRSPRTTGRAI